MHITEMRIRNFRNFLDAKFSFKEGVNTLIGENASGKSNALQALRLMLDESMSRSASYLQSADFCRALTNWKGHWIILSIDFADLDPAEGCQVLRHTAGHMNGTNTGTYTFLFRPKITTRRRLFELSGDIEQCTAFLQAISISDYEPVWTGRAAPTLVTEEGYRSVVGNLTDLTFPDPDREDLQITGVRIAPLHSEVACTFVMALRDVISELRGYKNNPLLALLRGLESDISITDSARIQGKVGFFAK